VVSVVRVSPACCPLTRRDNVRCLATTRVIFQPSSNAPNQIATCTPPDTQRDATAPAFILRGESKAHDPSSRPPCAPSRRG
jgi:hypothetical protein